MRVLHVNYEYPGVTENCGGGGRVTKLLSEGLDAMGVDSTVVTDLADRHFASFPIRTYAKIDRFLQSHDVDVIHGHFSIPSSLGLPHLSRKHNVGLVVSVMGADVHDPTRFRLIRPIANVVNRLIYKYADRVVAPSADIARRLPDHVDSRTIHYGIDTDRWPWGYRSLRPEPRILSVCRLVERKNLDLAIDAVEQLRLQGVDAQYRIVGTGPLQSHLEERAANRAWLSISGHVDDLCAAYHAADVFYLPSHHEAFGIVFLEALSTGLPVVTSPTGGQVDILERGLVGRSAHPDVDSQTQALQVLLSNYSVYQANTLGFVDRHFSDKRMVGEYLNLYQEVIE